MRPRHVRLRVPEDPDRVEAAVLYNRRSSIATVALCIPAIARRDSVLFSTAGRNADQVAVLAVHERVVRPGAPARSALKGGSFAPKIDAPRRPWPREHRERNGDRAEDERATPPPRSLLGFALRLPSVQTPSEAPSCAPQSGARLRLSASAWSAGDGAHRHSRRPVGELR